MSCWDACIKNSTLEIAVTDIYEMFVLKYRIVKEETSVSKIVVLPLSDDLYCVLTIKTLLHTLTVLPVLPLSAIVRKESTVEGRCAGLSHWQLSV